MTHPPDLKVAAEPGTAGTRPASRARFVEWLGGIPVAWKWSFAIAMIAIGGMAIFGFVMLQYQSRLFAGQIHQFGATVAGQLAEAAKEPLLAEDELQLRVLVSNVAGVDGILGAVVVPARGGPPVAEGIDPLAVDTTLPLGELFGDRPVQRDWNARDTAGGTLDTTLLTAPMRFRDVVVGHVLLVFDHRILDQGRHRFLLVLAVTTAAMIAVGTLASFYLARRMAQPIELLREAGRAYGEGRFHFRIRERRGDEFGELIDTMNAMGDGLTQKSRVEEALNRYVSEAVAKRIMGDIDHAALGGRHVEGSVMFADVSGFTALSETLPPLELGRLLNIYFGLIDRAAKLYDGTTDKFIGDCVMLVFGVTEPDSRHRLNALGCATLVRDMIDRLNGLRAAAGKATVQFHIGVNSGEMLAGNLGSAERMQFTVVGDSVNVASRLCSSAAPGEIAVTETLAHDPEIAARFHFELGNRLRMRGKFASAYVYRVGETYEPLQSEQQRLIARLLEEEHLVVAA